MAATYWIGSNGNIYYGSGQEGASVQDFGKADGSDGGQFEARADGLYDRYHESGTPTLVYSASQISNPSGGGTGVLGDSTGGTGDNLAGIRDAFNQQKTGIHTSAGTRADNEGRTLGTGIQSFIDELRSGQDQIDSAGAKNELARTQGVQGILGMVGRGIRSGGVMLANKNAGDSSAAEGISQAYGDVGRRQMSNVGNQYALGEEDIRLDQENLGRQMSSGVNRLREGKEVTINDIVDEARRSFTELNTAMADASLPDRIAIEQEKESVRQSVLAKLQQYDQMLSSGTAGIQAQSKDQRRTRAAELGRMGTELGADAFNFTTQVPGQFRNTGPFAGDLPIFTFPRSRRASA